MNKQITKDQSAAIMKLYHAGKTNLQIQDELGLSVRIIQSKIQRSGFPVNRYKEVAETPELKQFLIGCALGDGHYSNPCYKGRSNIRPESRLTIIHGLHQEEYLRYKRNILIEHGIEVSNVSYYTSQDKRIDRSPTHDMCMFKTHTHPIFTKYRKMFYSENGDRLYNNDNLSDIQMDAFCIWYLDDGHKCTRSYQITCTGMSTNDKQVCVNCLEKNTGIKLNIQKECLYLPTNYLTEFNKILHEFTDPIPTMKYKIRK